MNASDFKIRQFVEIKKIEVDKWHEGQRLNRDPGDFYVHHWVKENSKKFSMDWEKCLCKTCSKVLECGFKTSVDCPRHLPGN